MKKQLYLLAVMITMTTISFGQSLASLLESTREIHLTTHFYQNIMPDIENFDMIIPGTCNQYPDANAPFKDTIFTKDISFADAQFDLSAGYPRLPFVIKEIVTLAKLQPRGGPGKLSTTSENYFLCYDLMSPCSPQYSSRDEYFLVMIWMPKHNAWSLTLREYDYVNMVLEKDTHFFYTVGHNIYRVKHTSRKMSDNEIDRSIHDSSVTNPDTTDNKVRWINNNE